MHKPSAPSSTAQLLHSANQIAGQTLANLAAMANIAVPKHLRREKGWAGQLLEWHLGATAGSKPVPDFELIGVELKTIPVDRFGNPLETTYVCVAPLTDHSGQTWATSPVRQKLAHVLWVPILAERTIPVADRIIGTPILWQPTAQQDANLQADWEELMDLIALGKVTEITAKTGQYLQLRPKAANSHAKTSAIGADGQPIETLPRGFYLKKEFTKQVLATLLL